MKIHLELSLSAIKQLGANSSKLVVHGAIFSGLVDRKVKHGENTEITSNLLDNRMDKSYTISH